MIRYLVLVVMGMTLSGCAVQQPVPFRPEEHLRSLELVDQGVAFMRAGRLDEAEAAFRVAVQLSNIPNAYDGLGSVAFLRGNFSRAEKLFLQAYEQDSEYVHSLGNLALLYEFAGEKALAEQLYQRAIEEDPENFRVRNNFAVFVYEHYRGEDMRGRARRELLGAKALADHPAIEKNLRDF